jgi:hypothetical protein
MCEGCSTWFDGVKLIGVAVRCVWEALFYDELQMETRPDAILAMVARATGNYI